jgi:hypothetical protein
VRLGAGGALLLRQRLIEPFSELSKTLQPQATADGKQAVMQILAVCLPVSSPYAAIKSRYMRSKYSSRSRSRRTSNGSSTTASGDCAMRRRRHSGRWLAPIIWPSSSSTQRVCCSAF